MRKASIIDVNLEFLTPQPEDFSCASPWRLQALPLDLLHACGGALNAVILP